MKRNLAVLCGVLLLATHAYAEEGAKLEWFSCEEDRDCGRSERICGEPIGINLKHYKEYKKYLDEARPSVSCPVTRKVLNLRELHSICIANRCGFDPAPKYGDH